MAQQHLRRVQQRSWRLKKNLFTYNWCQKASFKIKTRGFFWAQVYCRRAFAVCPPHTYPHVWVRIYLKAILPSGGSNTEKASSNFWHSGLSEELVFTPAASLCSWGAVNPVSPQASICTSFWQLLHILYLCGGPSPPSKPSYQWTHGEGRVACHHHFRLPVIRAQVTIRRKSRAFRSTLRDTKWATWCN